MTLLVKSILVLLIFLGLNKKSFSDSQDWLVIGCTMYKSFQMQISLHILDSTLHIVQYAWN